MPYPVTPAGEFALTPAEYDTLGRPAGDGTVRAVSARTGQSERHTPLVCHDAAMYWRKVYALADLAFKWADDHPREAMEDGVTFIAEAIARYLPSPEEAARAYPWVASDLPAPEPEPIEGTEFIYSIGDTVPRVRWGMLNDVLAEIGARTAHLVA